MIECSFCKKIKSEDGFKRGFVSTCDICVELFKKLRIERQLIMIQVEDESRGLSKQFKIENDIRKWKKDKIDQAMLKIEKDLKVFYRM